MNKIIRKMILIFIVLIVIVSGVFYGGMKYEQSKNLPHRIFQKLSPEQHQQLFQRNMGGVFRKGTGLNFLSGNVIAKDEQSLTLKMPDGGSKIIFFSDSTEISKITKGIKDDIEIGKLIIVNGIQNPDRSVTAKTIQISLPPSNP